MMPISEIGETLGSRLCSSGFDKVDAMSLIFDRIQCFLCLMNKSDGLLCWSCILDDHVINKYNRLIATAIGRYVQAFLTYCPETNFQSITY